LFGGIVWGNCLGEFLATILLQYEIAVQL